MARPSASDRPALAVTLRETLRLFPHVGRTFRILWQTSPLLACGGRGADRRQRRDPGGAGLGRQADRRQRGGVAARAGGLPAAGAGRPLRLVGARAGPDGGLDAGQPPVGAAARAAARAARQPHQRRHPREGAGAGAAPLRGRRLLRQDATRAARGLVAAAVDGAGRAGHRPERDHPGQLRASCWRACRRCRC